MNRDFSPFIFELLNLKLRVESEYKGGEGGLL